MDFSIVYLFRGELNNEIEKLKRDISRFGPQHALEWPSILELRQGFDIPEEKLEEISLKFKGLIKNIKGFQITLDGFEFIEEKLIHNKEEITNYSVFIKIKKSNGLIELNEKLNQFRLDFNEDNNNFKPNIKLAFNDITKNNFLKIKNYLKDLEFNKTIMIDNITLLLNKNDRHIIYKQFRI